MGEFQNKNCVHELVKEAYLMGNALLAAMLLSVKWIPKYDRYSLKLTINAVILKHGKRTASFHSGSENSNTKPEFFIRVKLKNQNESEYSKFAIKKHVRKCLVACCVLLNFLSSYSIWKGNWKG